MGFIFFMQNIIIIIFFFHFTVKYDLKYSGPISWNSSIHLVLKCSDSCHSKKKYQAAFLYETVTVPAHNQQVALKHLQ